MNTTILQYKCSKQVKKSPSAGNKIIRLILVVKKSADSFGFVYASKCILSLKR